MELNQSNYYSTLTGWFDANHNPYSKVLPTAI